MLDQTPGFAGFHHLALRVRDFDASVRFYTEGLGLTESIRWGEGDSRAVMLAAGNGNYLEIFAGGAAEPRPEGVVIHFALRAADVDAAVQRAVAAGAEVTVNPKDHTIVGQPCSAAVRLAFVKGPDGELVEFFHSDQL